MKVHKDIKKNKLVHKLRNRLSLRTALRQVTVVTSAVIVVVSIACFIFFNTTNIHVSKATGPSTCIIAYFKADLHVGAVVFSWATDLEVNNDYFTIERSSDGIHFSQFSRHQGAGNSTSRVYYTAVDENLLEGYSYYRLKQTDFDGLSTFSEIKTIKYKSGESTDPDFTLVSVAPNPFTEKFTVSFILKTATNIDLQLINSAGQIVYKNLLTTKDGMNQVDFTDTMDLPAGVYILHLIYNDKIINQKIIKS